ncbi:GCN5-related N-acetyltransferase 5, chloroplastic [Cornus florida]|uniref:GCN5-related N-acetyltransferase 5, chloroplastic n=1 Tax=Cornus florida TaxID=4283 RepID=UPI00289CDD63|nr:GCN5-related N-acetyltransferase 5, chloroplastic [Cornus florida]
MARTISLSFSLDPQSHHHHHHHHPPPYSTTLYKPHQTPFLAPKHTNPLLASNKSSRYNLTLSFSSSHPSSPTSSSSTLQDSVRSGRFFTAEELKKLQFLENFRYYQELRSGSMWVRVMKENEIDMTVGLLSESFAESMLLPMAYVNLLGFLVKQYLIERRTLIPHTVTLIGFYRGEDEGDEELAATAELCFNKRGANASPPTPTPPKESPYICNMTVKKPLRRKGIGWHLLKASEELISHMSYSRDVFLHCRMIDAVPFNMYIKAGYGIVKTDSILIWLTLQRRKHLMWKKLPMLDSPSESDVSDPTDKIPS